LGRIGIVEEGQKKMLEGRIFMMTIARELYGAVQSLFETSRE